MGSRLAEREDANLPKDSWLLGLMGNAFFQIRFSGFRSKDAWIVLRTNAEWDIMNSVHDVCVIDRRYLLNGLSGSVCAITHS